jgi:predicted MPP superfamily phosphohydrolase
MVQFTDIHFGEDEPDDLDNMRLIGDILDQEKPDIAIITGDVVSGYAWDQKTKPWAATQYQNLTDTLTKYNTYWATTAGNHDSEADLTREEVSEFDRSFNLSLTQPNAANISHAFNYFLPVYDKNGSEIQFRLWFLDTGHEDCLNEKGWDCVRPDQVEWFRREHRKINDNSKGKGFLFIHIPISEYMNLYNDFSFFGN